MLHNHCEPPPRDLSHLVTICSTQVISSRFKKIDLVAELPEANVASETQRPTNLAGFMVMVNMFGWPILTYAAQVICASRR